MQQYLILVAVKCIIVVAKIRTNSYCLKPIDLLAPIKTEKQELAHAVAGKCKQIAL